jgi:hypothetical protein
MPPFCFFRYKEARVFYVDASVRISNSSLVISRIVSALHYVAGDFTCQKREILQRDYRSSTYRLVVLSLEKLNNVAQ